MLNTWPLMLLLVYLSSSSRQKGEIVGQSITHGSAIHDYVIMSSTPFLVSLASGMQLWYLFLRVSPLALPGRR